MPRHRWSRWFGGAEGGHDRGCGRRRNRTSGRCARRHEDAALGHHVRRQSIFMQQIRTGSHL
jgi:hypothetical protein